MEDCPDIDVGLDDCAGVSNVPRVPSGKERVWMSTEESAVVGFDSEGRFALVGSNPAMGRSWDFRGRSGKAGLRSLSSLWSGTIVAAESFRAPVSSPMVDKARASSASFPILNAIVDCVYLFSNS